ncbi:unnamed protein product [Sphenostylis stenocarpa]|uniref:non-specific serine/threonine protein kinase n=1 Tax=Sphenostylis stenocarpa TaxID=92480 RepID=A0AA86T1N1_9FABA|nr:unnamed protein product [Sphenostylis stenocarpa]
MFRAVFEALTHSCKHNSEIRTEKVERERWRENEKSLKRERESGGLMVLIARDHLALMMELLGMMPRKIALGGRYSRDFFNRYGDLRHIRRLRFWPLNKVLMEKYDFSEKDANDMTDFLVPILDFVPEKRPTAGQCLLHPWINVGPRLLEPSNHNPAAETAALDLKKREKDEREAMEAGMGNIVINSDSKSLMQSPSKKTFQGTQK